MSIADAQATKKVLLTYPQLKDDGDLANNGYVDTKGFGYVEFLLITGLMDAALGSTAEGTAPKIEECDTTDGTYTAVTDAALAAAIAADQGGKIHQIDVNLTDGTRKRYMRINTPHSGNGTTGVTFAAIAILSKPQTFPTSAAERGLVEHIKA